MIDQCARVLRWLGTVEALHRRLSQPDWRQNAELIRAELLGTISAWRRLLDSHPANDLGRCPGCRGWLRQRRWPCPIWRWAHTLFVTHDSAVPLTAPVHPLGSASMPQRGQQPRAHRRHRGAS